LLYLKPPPLRHESYSFGGFLVWSKFRKQKIEHQNLQLRNLNPKYMEGGESSKKYLRNHGVILLGYKLY